MLRIEELKVGDELVYVDKNNMGRRWGDYPVLWCEGKINVIKISHLKDGVAYFKDGEFHLKSHELKYFKKKEEPKHTFNDLIDVAVQAYKDGVIDEFHVKSGSLRINNRMYYESDLGASCFEDIQSLYKETFVIESEEDLKRIDVGAKIKLNGGQDIEFRNNHGEYLWFIEGVRVPLSFNFVKGATVEQDRNV